MGGHRHDCGFPVRGMRVRGVCDIKPSPPTYTLAVRRRAIGRSPWRWIIAAIRTLFASLTLPSMFEPLPDYAQHDTFELVMFYAVPAVIGSFGVALALIALRSGIFVDEQGLIVKPFAGLRRRRIPVDTIRALTVTREQGPVFEWVSPAVVLTSGKTIVLGLAHYNTARGRERALAQAEVVARRFGRPVEMPRASLGQWTNDADSGRTGTGAR